MAQEYKFDIFEVLTQLTKKHIQFIDNLTDDEVKSISPLIMMRWLSGTTTKSQIYLLNEVANPLVFSLQKHPRLLLKVLMACTTQNSGRYQWIKRQPTTSSHKPNSIRVVMEYFGYSTRKATSAIEVLSKDQVLAMAEELGYQLPDIKKIQSEYKNPTKSSTTGSKSTT